MRTISWLICICLLIAAFSSAAFADNYGQIKFIGFSENGKYLAFEEWGTMSVLMGDKATYYIDTAKNSFAIAPTYLEASEGPDGKPDFVRAEIGYKRRVLVKLKKLGIMPGNTGQPVVAHFLNDFSFMKRTEHENFFFEKNQTPPIRKMMPDYTGGFILQNSNESEKVIFNDLLAPNLDNTDEFYELTLIPTPAKRVEGCSDVYKFELTLLNNTEHREPRLQILQKDGDRLPKSRDCPFRYRIERVYVYIDTVAVFLNMFNPGEETPDMRYLVVTGIISGR
jgi:predicted secreted protein